MSDKFRDDTITTARLISFSDGVFAIAVTLLVFNLKVPQIPKDQAQLLLPGMIKDLVPHFSTYIITFLLVAVYWTFHHRMLNLVTHINSAFLWMNICYLLMISFMPFPSALFGAYPNEILSFVFYISSMIMVGGLAMLILGYASYKYRLISKDIPMYVIKYYFYRQLISLIVFFLSIPLAFYQLRWAQYFLLILFPINGFMRKSLKRYAEKS